MQQTTNSAGRISYSVLRTVKEVLLQENVSAAARRLGISQSAATQNIKRFETLTGISLQRKSSAVTGFSLSENLRASLFAAVSNLEDLLNLSQEGENYLPRLGISDCLGFHLERNTRQLHVLLKSYFLQIGKPLELAELHSRGELDAVVRPLFHYETDNDLTAECSLIWKQHESRNPTEFSMRTSPNSIALISRSSASPFAHHISKKLQECPQRFNVACNIDDIFLASEFSRKTGFHFPVPEFIAREFCKEEVQSAALNEFSVRVLYGVQYNKKKVSLSAALMLLDFCELVFE